MCSELDLGSAARERPVDHPRSCRCSVPESIQIVVRRIQILSFEDFPTVGSRGHNKATIGGAASDAA